MGRYYRTVQPKQIDYWYKPPLAAMERASRVVDARTDNMLSTIDGLNSYFRQRDAEKKTRQKNISYASKRWRSYEATRYHRSKSLCPATRCLHRVCL